MRPAYGAWLFRAILFTSLASAAACRSVPTIPPDEGTLVAQQYDGHYFTLRQSMYFGPCYDDPRVLLLEPRSFDTVDHLLTPSGKPMSPGASLGIIPAGTRVRIERVAFPTAATMVASPLLTPRFNPQVFLRINRFDVPGVEGFQDRVHVLLLPVGVASAETALALLEQALGPDDTVKTWMDGRSPAVRLAIARKEVLPGMAYQEMVAALGPPDHIQRSEDGGPPVETATYGERQVQLVNGSVQASK